MSNKAQRFGQMLKIKVFSLKNMEIRVIKEWQPLTEMLERKLYYAFGEMSIPAISSLLRL